jgi:hypothetical protein
VLLLAAVYATIIRGWSAARTVLTVWRAGGPCDDRWRATCQSLATVWRFASAPGSRR